MKRSMIGALMLGVVAFVPGTPGAVIDGTECSMTFPAGRVLAIQPGAGVDADRFSVCVSDGDSANGAELYVGGELDPELASSGEDFCGAIVVAGRALGGTPDWDYMTPGADPFDPADDVHLSCD